MAVGLGLRRGDHVGEGLEGAAGMGRQHVRCGADQQHRLEVLLGIERQGLQERIDRVGVEHEQPVAAVGRRLRHLRRAEASGGAGLVLDDDGGVEPLLQPGLHHAGDRVDRAARRERHDDFGNIGRRGLRQNGRREDGLRQRRGRGGEQECASRNGGHGSSLAANWDDVAPRIVTGICRPDTVRSVPRLLRRGRGPEPAPSRQARRSRRRASLPPKATRSRPRSRRSLIDAL